MIIRENGKTAYLDPEKAKEFTLSDYDGLEILRKEVDTNGIPQYRWITSDELILDNNTLDLTADDWKKSGMPEFNPQTDKIEMGTQAIPKPEKVWGFEEQPEDIAPEEYTPDERAKIINEIKDPQERYDFIKKNIIDEKKIQKQIKESKDFDFRMKRAIAYKEAYDSSKYLNKNIFQKLVASPLRKFVFDPIKSSLTQIMLGTASAEADLLPLIVSNETIDDTQKHLAIYYINAMKYGGLHDEHEGFIKPILDKDIGKFASEVLYTSMVSLPFSALGIVSPFVSSVLMFGSSYGQQRLSTVGVSEKSQAEQINKAFVYGLAEAGSEWVGDKIQNVLIKNEVQKALGKTILKNAGKKLSKSMLVKEFLKDAISKEAILSYNIEGFEELLSNGVEQIYDLIKGDREKFNVVEGLDNYIGGMTSAKITEVPMRIGYNIQQYNNAKKSRGKQVASIYADTKGLDVAKFVDDVYLNHKDNIIETIQKAMDDGDIENAVKLYGKLINDRDYSVLLMEKVSEEKAKLIQEDKDIIKLGKDLSDKVNLLDEKTAANLLETLQHPKDYRTIINEALTRMPSVLNKDDVSYIFDFETGQVKYPDGLDEKDKTIITSLAKQYDNAVINKMFTNAGDLTQVEILRQIDNILKTMRNVKKSALSATVKDRYLNALADVVIGLNAMRNGRDFEFYTEEQLRNEIDDYDKLKSILSGKPLEIKKEVSKKLGREPEEVKSEKVSQTKLQGSADILSVARDTKEKQLLETLMNKAYFDDIVKGKDVPTKDFLQNIDIIREKVAIDKRNSKLLSILREYQKLAEKNGLYLNEKEINKYKTKLDNLVKDFENAETIEDKDRIKEKLFKEVKQLRANPIGIDVKEYANKVDEMKTKLTELRKKRKYEAEYKNKVIQENHNKNIDEIEKIFTQRDELIRQLKEKKKATKGKKEKANIDKEIKRLQGIKKRDVKSELIKYKNENKKSGTVDNYVSKSKKYLDDIKKQMEVKNAEETPKPKEPTEKKPEVQKPTESKKAQKPKEIEKKETNEKKTKAEKSKTEVHKETKKSENKVYSEKENRKRGYRETVSGKVYRAKKIDNKLEGNETDLIFAEGVKPKGKMTIIEANDLIPSHRQGQRNDKHFIGEAQPKERTDKVSVATAQKIAEKLDPEQITIKTVNAYSGMPTVNERGEVIQGNNRAEALKIAYENNTAENYRQWLINNADKLGIDPKEIAKMKNPVLVNMLNVDDDTAIKLGQYDVKDLETGGKQRINGLTVAKKIDNLDEFIYYLFGESQEDIPLREQIRKNGAKALKWLVKKGVITNTQYLSAFDRNGITKDAINDIEDILLGHLFIDSVSDIASIYEELPARVKDLLINYGYKLSKTLRSDLQQAIIGYKEYAEENRESKIPFKQWVRQKTIFNQIAPKDKYSPKALYFISEFAKANEKGWKSSFKDKIKRYLEATETKDLFNEPMHPEEAFNKYFKGVKNEDNRTTKTSVSKNVGRNGNGRGTKNITPEVKKSTVENRPGQTDTTADREPSGLRPPIVVVSERDIPKPRKVVNVGDYPIDEHQELGINLALQRIEKKGNGFLLADGTGVGKTRELLLIAFKQAERTGKTALIVTQNKQIVEGFKREAKTLGIDLKNIEFATYDDIRTDKAGNKSYSVVLFDEAHNLKNIDSKKTIKAKQIKADNRVYATATPMDTLSSATYFLSEITGKSQKEIEKMLGYEVVEKIENGRKVKQVILLKGHTWNDIVNNLLKLRDKAVGQGAMIRREYPFYGEVTTDHIGKFSKEQEKELEKINRYWNAKISNIRGKDAKARRLRINYGGQRTGEISRWTELQKVDYIFNKVLNDVKAGKKVIVVADGINPTKIKALNKEIDAFMPVIMRKLDEAGIEYAKVFGKGKKINEIDKFNSGDVPVLLMTPQSGGTGVNLDDTVGDSPRTMYVATANYSGNVYSQILGRVSRRNTKSPAKVVIVFSDSNTDERRKEILRRKLDVLKAIQKGDFPVLDEEKILYRAIENELNTFDTLEEKITQLFGKDKGILTQELMSRILDNIAKRMGITRQELDEKIYYHRVESVDEDIIRAVIDNQLTVKGEKEDIETILYQENKDKTFETPKHLKARYDLTNSEEDLWLSRLLLSYGKFKKATLEKTKQTIKDELTHIRNEIDSFGSSIKWFEGFTEKYVRDNIAEAEKNGDVNGKTHWEGILNNKEYREKIYNEIRKEQRQSLLGLYNYLTSSNKPLGMQYLLLKYLMNYKHSVDGIKITPENREKLNITSKDKVIEYKGDKYLIRVNRVKTNKRNSRPFDSADPAIFATIQTAYANAKMENIGEAYISELYKNAEDTIKISAMNIDKDLKKYVFKKTDKGVWLRIPQNTSPETILKLGKKQNTIVKDRSGKWCFASPNYAQIYSNKEMYFYIDEKGNPVIGISYDPKYNMFTEAPRGTEAGQNVAPEYADELENFLKHDIKGGEKYLIQTRQLKLISRFKQNNWEIPKDLTEDDLEFIMKNPRQKDYGNTEEWKNLFEKVKNNYAEILGNIKGYDKSLTLTILNDKDINKINEDIKIIDIQTDDLDDINDTIEKIHNLNILLDTILIHNGATVTISKKIAKNIITMGKEVDIVIKYDKGMVAEKIDTMGDIYVKLSSIDNKVANTIKCSAIKFDKNTVINSRVADKLAASMIELGDNITINNYIAYEFIPLLNDETITLDLEFVEKVIINHKIAKRIDRISLGNYNALELNSIIADKIRRVRFYRSGIKAKIANEIERVEIINHFGDVNIEEKIADKIGNVSARSLVVMHKLADEIRTVSADMINLKANISDNVLNDLKVSMLFINGNVHKIAKEIQTKYLEVNGITINEPVADNIQYLEARGLLSKNLNEQRFILVINNTNLKSQLSNKLSGFMWKVRINIKDSVIYSNIFHYIQPKSVIKKLSLNIDNTDINSSLMKDARNILEKLNIEFKGVVNINHLLLGQNYIPTVLLYADKSSKINIQKYIANKAGELKILFDVNKINGKVLNTVSLEIKMPKGDIKQKLLNNIYLDARITFIDKESGFEETFTPYGNEDWVLSHIADNIINEYNLYNQDNRGAIAKVNDKYYIFLSKNSDITTPLHELAHLYEDVLTEDERQIVLDWAGDKEWTRATSEKFAKGFEKYLYDETDLKENIFQKFAKWLKEIINNAIAYFGDISELNPQMREIYRKMLEKQTPKKKAVKKVDSVSRLAKKIFGSDKNIVYVKEILTPTGLKALGKYWQGLIYLAEGEGDIHNTYLHEAVHFAIDKFLTEEEKDILFSSEPNEEKIAEGFISYVNDRESFTGRLKAIFRKLWRRIKLLFKRGYIYNVLDFYDDLYGGKFKNKVSQNVYSEIAKYKDEYDYALASKKTAIKRTKTARPTQYILNDVSGDILHFGSGQDSFTTNELKSKGSVTEYDKYYNDDKEALKKEYDTVVSNYVLNTLPRKIRQDVIKQISDLTKGTAFITVRADKIKGVPYDDGVITSKGTFQKSYTPETILRELSPHFDRVSIYKKGSGFIIVKAENVTPVEYGGEETKHAKFRIDDLATMSITDREDAVRTVIDRLLDEDEVSALYNILTNKGLTLNEFIKLVSKGKKLKGANSLINSIKRFINLADNNQDVLDKIYSNLYKVRLPNVDINEDVKRQSLVDLSKAIAPLRKIIDEHNINLSTIEVGNKIAWALFKKGLFDLSKVELRTLNTALKIATFKDGVFKLNHDGQSLFSDDAAMIEKIVAYEEHKAEVRARLDRRIKALEEKAEKMAEKYKRKRYKIPFHKKLYFTLTEVLGDIAMHINDTHLIEVGYHYAQNLRKFLEMRDTVERGFYARNRKALDKLYSNKDYMIALIHYLDKGGDTPHILEINGLSNLAEDLKDLMNSTKGLVAKRRIKKWFEGKLSDKDFTEKQLAYLNKWEKLYHFKDEAMRGTNSWYGFLNDLKDLKIDGVEEFVYKHYFPHKREIERIYNMLDGNITLEDIFNDSLPISTGQLKSRKEEDYKFDEDTDAVNIVMAVYNNAVRYDLLEDDANYIYGVAKTKLDDTSKIKLIGMLKKGMGLTGEQTRFTKRIKRLMGETYKVLAMHLQMQGKNVFQRLLKVRRLSDLKYLFKGSKELEKFLKKNNMSRYYGRFVSEMSERYGINELFEWRERQDTFNLGKDKIENFKDFLVAVTDLYINTNRVFDPVFRQVIDLQKFLDKENRASDMMKYINDALTTVRKYNNFGKISNRLMIDSLLPSEQVHLWNTYKNYGLREFAYEYGKIMTMRKEYEYIPQLKSLFNANTDILSYSFLKYAVWTMSFQKDVARNITNIAKGNNIEENTRELIGKIVTGEIVKLILSALFGNLREEDESWWEAIKQSLINFFNPMDYRGSWGASTLGFPNPYVLYKVLSGNRVYADELMTKSAGFPVYLMTQVMLSTLNSGAYLVALLQDDEDKQEQSLKAIANHIHRFGKSTMYLYDVTSAIISSITGRENFNIIRNAIDEDYDPKETKRDFYSNMVYPIFRQHKPTLKKESGGKILTPEQMVKKLRKNLGGK